MLRSCKRVANWLTQRGDPCSLNSFTFWWFPRQDEFCRSSSSSIAKPRLRGAEEEDAILLHKSSLTRKTRREHSLSIYLEAGSSLSNPGLDLEFLTVHSESEIAA